MANSARTQPGVERTTTVNEPEIDPIENIQGVYEKNKKVITTSATVVILAVVLYFGYTKMYKGPAETKASTMMATPLMYYNADSLNMALNGDGKNFGFTKIAKNYKGTAAGNLANFYEGACFLKLGKYNEAIKAFESFDGKGTMVANEAYGLLGQAYMESGNSAKAIDNFKKATADADDALITPLYLYHLGMAYAASNNVAEAKNTFKRIRDEYPRSIHARDMDKELARLGELN